MRRLRRVDIERREELLAALERFAAELKRRYPVEAVYLYGSFASGEIHEGSDIDLVVVGHFPERFVERIGLIQDLTDLPVEPLVYTPEEFRQMTEEGNPLIAEVLRTGRKL